MRRVTDAFVTNSLAGKDYLMQTLGVAPQAIFARPYQVPDVAALLKQSEQVKSDSQPFQCPIFLFAGQLIPRKGLHQLLEACRVLRDRGYHNYTLLVAGEGPQRQALQEFCRAENLDAYVYWLGWVSYGQLGAYFQSADVFILPTLEDVWGMVVLEAMAFGKPILCSQRAGASEMVLDGENGHLFEPDNPEDIADAMARLIDTPEQIMEMGQRSQQLIAHHTPGDAAQFLTKVTHMVAEVRL
ncbi:glycosyltransferase family 4 protein [Leptolyngbya sp. 7M]|uniref:glycosyltransferase family 4 protein n=1 Tax=Leptolyngbya sp. 7M TaxID=2812896 RepID=UPI001B8AF2E6|nr:glycosyltransferase family 4 protein [Leptolyngbya sp. 7M]QYO62492.1 glycosyltransferase family 4 protein [Leptolyngbya sp. 7M]